MVVAYYRQMRIINSLHSYIIVNYKNKFVEIEQDSNIQN